MNSVCVVCARDLCACVKGCQIKQDEEMFCTNCPSKNNKVRLDYSRSEVSGRKSEVLKSSGRAAIRVTWTENLKDDPA